MQIPLLPFTTSLPRLTVTAIIDILIVAFLIYELIQVVRHTRAAHVLTGIGVLLGIYLVAVWAGLGLLRSILDTVVPYTAIALIVLFQAEIRRTLARIGRRGWLGLSGELERRESFDDILLALGRLSQDRVGALIVLERHTGLRTFIESGVALDARVSRDLLLSVFQPGSALHDGAVIIRGDRVRAAACFLPLSMNPALARKLGTRHRAAIGITEEADCLTLVVSEETGRLSVAAFGEIELDLSLSRIEERLNKHFGRQRRRPRPLVAETPRLRPDAVGSNEQNTE